MLLILSRILRTEALNALLDPLFADPLFEIDHVGFISHEREGHG